MLNAILSFIFIISLSVASINFFNLDDVILSYFQEEIDQGDKIPVKVFSSSEHIERGNSYMKQGFVELARDEFLQAANKSQASELAYIRLANAQTLLKNYDGAIQNLQYASKLNNSPTIQLALAKNFIKKQDFETALGILTIIEQTSEESSYYKTIIDLLNQEEIDASISIPFSESFTKSQEIQKAFDEFSLQQDGQQVFLRALIAKALIQNQDFELAHSFLQQALNLRSDYRDAWIMLGYTELNFENYTKAKKAYEHAYDLDPTKAETQFFLAIAYEELDEKEKALEFYQLAFKNQYTPKSHVIQKIAELSLNLGYYSEAFKLYEELLKITHDDADSFIRPVWIAIDKLSDLEKAEQMASWAQSLYPNSAQSYNLLAWVFIEKQEYPQAQKQLNSAFAIDPLFAAAHYNQGLLYEQTGKLENALSSYERAYRQDKDGPIGNLAAQEYNRLMTN